MTGPVTTEALVEALVACLEENDHRSRYQQALALLSGPLVPIITDAAETRASLQQVTAERDEARDLAYELKLAAAGGEDVPGSANLVTPEDVRRWRDEDARQLATATSELARLRERLEIAHAYDGAGNKIPFPEGMEHLDGIECRDETIRNLEEQIARLRAEGEAKDRALKPFADFASSWVVQTAAQRDELLTLSNGERMCGIKATAFIDADTALARAATAREG